MEMKDDYKVLKIMASVFKILAFVGLVGTLLITLANFKQLTNPDQQMMRGNLGFFIFNNLFPIFFGLLQTTVLYTIGEGIILFIDIKDDLTKIINK